MNRIIISGNLVRDPEIRVTAGDQQLTIARFTVAVRRKVKRGAEAKTDFIDCVAFGYVATFMEKWFKKGQSIICSGALQRETYKDKDGNNRYSWNVVVDDVDFGVKTTEAPEQAVQMPSQAPKTASGDLDPDWSNIPDGIDESELPFGG